MRLLFYLLFAFQVQLLSYCQSTYNYLQRSPVLTPYNPLTYRNLLKSISPSLTTSTTYNNTGRSKQHHQTSSKPLTYHDCTFLFAFLWKIGTVGKHTLILTK